MFEVIIDQPRWARRWPARVLLRMLGIDRRWIARGRTGDELDQDMRRVAERAGVRVDRSAGTWSLVGGIGSGVEVSAPGLGRDPGRPCASSRCSKSVGDGPEPGGTPSPDPAFCSWGCLAGERSRLMWQHVREAKAAAVRARRGRS